MTPTAPINVACLCAAWCRLCDDYLPVLRSLAEELAGEHPHLRWHWVDIEDEAELVGDLDVETFPTLVIADDRQARFAGPVTPQRETLRRLLRATVHDTGRDAAWPAVPAAVDQMIERLRRRTPDWPERD